MIDSLLPYPEYKDAGTRWLGRVPTHWAVVPNRATFAEVNERGHPNEEMLSVTISQGVIRQAALLADSSKKDSSNQDKANYKLVCPGDFAYNKMRAWQGAAGVSQYRGIVSPAYIVIRPRSPHEMWYFHYLFRTPAFTKEAERWSYGISSDQWSLRIDDFKRIYTCIPPRDEQAAIVRFLDHADRRIRRYIRAKRQLIALLNEQKQAIIHRAVTRGLDPNVGLKPSGVEWLGDVPEHWRVTQIGRLARVGNGSTPSRGNIGYWINGSFPWLNSSSVNQASIAGADQYVTEVALKECHLPRVQPGSVLVAITGQGKTRGTAARLMTEATINQHIAYLTPREGSVTQDFLYLALTAAYRELRRISDDAGSTKGALTCGDLKHFRVALPPVDEQAAVFRFVEEITDTLARWTGHVERGVQLISEYRTRLIADVVTGKLDVREAAARLPEETGVTDELEPVEELLLDTDEALDDVDLDAEPEEVEA